MRRGPMGLRGALVLFGGAIILPICGTPRGSMNAQGSPAGALASAWGPTAATAIAKRLTEAPRIDEVALSPLATHVIYRVVRADATANRFKSELVVGTLTDSREGIQTTAILDSHITDREPGKYVPVWCPDGRCLTFFPGTAAGVAPSLPSSSSTEGPKQLIRYDITSGLRSTVPFQGVSKARVHIGAIASDYQWSPKGRFLAFTAPLDIPTLDPRKGTAVTSQGPDGSSVNHGLFVVTASTGAVRQLSPDSLHVMDFNWAPDEHSLVVSASADAQGVPHFRTDLFVIDRTSSQFRSLVVQPGLDCNPAWSPDGKWIAFSSHFGFQTYYAGRPALVPAAGGEVVRLGPDEGPTLGSPSNRGYPIFWAPDSSAFFYAARYHLVRPLFRVDVQTHRLTELSSEAFYDDNVSMSADRRWRAFTRESGTRPPELFVEALPSGNPIALTDIGGSSSMEHAVQSETMNWRSSDRRFTIHGVLLTPRDSAISKTEFPHIDRPRPTLVFLAGGPSMVENGFIRDYNNGAPLALAALGYAVLIPNTRGRDGYGEAFQRGMRDGPSAARLPYEDAIAGLEALIQRSIADPDRLGVFGHSYGGYLTAYATTRTNRFRAAVVHEAHVFEWPTRMLQAPPGTDWALLMRDLYGFRDAFDSVERARLITESPGLNMNHVQTPSLLLFGTTNGARSVGRPLFGALQWRNVPSELVIYDEGHVFSRPAAAVDALERTAAWLDYWIRGQPYPDAERARSYNEWRMLHRPSSSP